MKKIILFLLISSTLTAASKHNIDTSSDEDHSVDDLYRDEVPSDDDLFSDPLREMDRDEDAFFDELEAIHKPQKVPKPKKETGASGPKVVNLISLSWQWSLVLYEWDMVFSSSRKGRHCISPAWSEAERGV